MHHLMDIDLFDITAVLPQHKQETYLQPKIKLRSLRMFRQRTLFLLLLSWLPSVILSNNCDSPEPTYAMLKRDESTGGYSFLKQVRLDGGTFEVPLGDNIGGRSLRKDGVSQGKSQLRSEWLQGIIPEISASKSMEEGRALSDTSDAEEYNIEEWFELTKRGSTSTFFAIECSCFEDYETYYCPFVADAEITCQQPEGREPQCHVAILSDDDNLVLYVAIMWMVLSCLPFLVTKYGRSAIDYPISLCIKGWTRHRLERMMANDPVRAAIMLREYEERRLIALGLRRTQGHRRPMREIIETTRPAFLTLPTQRLSMVCQDCGNTDVEAPQQQPQAEEIMDCSICLEPLVDNDRVGKLDCNHFFHANCLKVWIRRRNSCPLCQNEYIATPHFNTPESKSALQDC